MFPFVYAPTFEYPLSGDVSQGISPSFGIYIEGIPEVEHEVVTSVASYGKQLGKLTEAVLALAEKAGLDGPEIAAVREIAEGVAEAKTRARDKVEARAATLQSRAEKLSKL